MAGVTISALPGGSLASVGRTTDLIPVVDTSEAVLANKTKYMTPAALFAALNNTDITTALGFTPRNAATATVNTFNTRSDSVALLDSDVIDALGYTPAEAGESVLWPGTSQILMDGGGNLYSQNATLMFNSLGVPSVIYYPSVGGDPAPLAMLNDGVAQLNYPNGTQLAGADGSLWYPDGSSILADIHGHLLNAPNAGTTVAAAAGAGTGGAATLSANAGDCGGVLTVVTGADANNTDPWAVLTFANSFASAPIVAISPADPVTAANGASASADTTGFTVLPGLAAPGVLTTYTWNYIVRG